MDIIKRNIALSIFLALSLLAAVVLAIMMRQYAASAGKLDDEVVKLQAFFRDLQQEKVAVSKANYDIARENRQLVEEQLGDLKEQLWEKSHIPVQRYTGIAAKDLLREETARMRLMLEDRGIELGNSIPQLSFGKVLQREGVPDEVNEVPVLVKELAVIEEIVRLVTSSGLNRLIDLERTSGSALASLEHYDVMPMSLTVNGKLSTVKRFITALQEDAGYFFFVHYFSVGSERSVQGAIAGRPRQGKEKDRETTTGPGEAMAPFPEMMPGEQFPPPATYVPERREREETQRDMAADGEPLDKDERAVGLNDIVTVKIRLDFLEFHKPQQEK
ncbi:MAG: Amuc_1100 family pilus-like protein [Candidatus Pacebacteria bacterium]|nr:Amuc_1100 family pilus-like protein [Candidatus Paceibacterota bacterium]